jgi:uncharacterized protein YjiS (DUF1127 family)
MSTITRSFPGGGAVLPTGWSAFGKRIPAAAGRLAVAWTNYRGLTALARMDDRGLADIGLSRSDVSDALSQRWWDDPTRALNERRGVRRTRTPPVEAGFRQPPTDRPSRYSV